MKMYILVKEDISMGFALLAVAHGSLALYLKYKDDPDTTKWLSGPFYKVICKVNDAEFKKAKECPNFITIRESKLGDQEVALVFKPREEWPKHFKFYRLYN